MGNTERLEHFLSTEAKRLRREADRMERDGSSGYATIIRIYRNDASSMEAELAEIRAAREVA